MVTAEDIKKLAALARIDIPADQMESVRHDIQSILAYVDGINEAGAKLKKAEADTDQTINDIHIVKSVLRDDGEADEPGIHTETLLAAAPEREGDYVKVKKILSYEN